MPDRPNRRGRPTVGTRISIRLPPDLLARLDAQAATNGESRAVVVRQLLARALAVPPHGDEASDGVDRAQIHRMLALTPRERIRHMTDVANGMIRLRERVPVDTA